MSRAELLVLFVVFLLPGPLVLGARRQAAGVSDPNARAERILQQMTLEEKIDLVGGVDGFFLPGVPRLNVPRMKMADGPFGVRGSEPATAIAGGIALAATWDPDLAERAGVALGRDARARGVHFLLAPGVNIYVAPLNGRNFEYFGEDPWLASRMAVGYIRGVQSQGVSATAKHFLGNNSEFDRHRTDVIVDERALREIYLPAFEAAASEAHVGAIMTSYNLVNGHHMSQHGAINNDIVKKEWGFAGLIMSDWTSTYDAIAAANGGLDVEMPSGAMMNRRNLIPAIKDGKVSHATIDDKARRILRVAARLGWLDRSQTDASIPKDNPAGRDAALQSARQSIVLLKNDNLARYAKTAALRQAQGRPEQSRGAEKGTVPPPLASNSARATARPRRSGLGSEAAKAGPISVSAIRVLPIDRRAVKTIAVVGPLAHPAVPVGGGSAAVQPHAAVSFRDGIARVAGAGVDVKHHRGIAPLTELVEQTSFTTHADAREQGIRLEGFTNTDLAGTPKVSRIDRHINIAGPFFEGADRGNGSSARWVGYFHAQRPGVHHVAVQTTRGDGGYRVLIDDKILLDNWRLGKPLVSHASVTLSAGPHKVVMEQFRRAEWGKAATRLGIVHDDRLIDPAVKAMAAQADIVIATVGFDTETEGEASDRTFALPFGQDELIRALVDANARTVVTITSGGGVDMTRWIDRVPALVQTWYPGQEGGTALAELVFGDVNFSGRLPVTFERRLEDNPSLDSYYPAPGTTRVVYKNGVFVGYRGFEKHGKKPLFPFGFGLSYTEFAYGNLHVSPTSVAFEIKNIGAREGAAIAQVYIAERQPAVPRPPKELKGFAKVALKPGESKSVTVPLDRRAFSYFDSATREWRVHHGGFIILVGSSSADTPLKAVLRMQ